MNEEYHVAMIMIFPLGLICQRIWCIMVTSSWFLSVFFFSFFLGFPFTLFCISKFDDMSIRIHRDAWVPWRLWSELKMGSIAMLLQHLSLEMFYLKGNWYRLKYQTCVYIRGKIPWFWPTAIIRCMHSFGILFYYMHERWVWICTRLCRGYRTTFKCHFFSSQTKGLSYMLSSAMPLQTEI